MRVRLIAYTVLAGWDSMRDAGWVDYENGGPTPGDFNDWTEDADYLAEFAGRLCYQSWNRPNPATATNAGYLANILGQQHYSVLEHASATFYVDGVSRSLSHELVRHRHLSFSQVSQRYVDESRGHRVLPPAVERLLETVESDVKRDIIDRLEMLGHATIETYRTLVVDLTQAGLSRKEARQAARAVLPNMTETKFVVTGNMRAWRDVIAKRNSPHADAEIRLLAAEILRQLKEIAPNTFQDMAAQLAHAQDSRGGRSAAG